MQSRLIYLALILAGLSTGAHAGLNKCKGANGHIILQDAPCPPPAGTPVARMPTLAERNALAKQQKLDAKQPRYSDSRPGSNWDEHRMPGERLRLGRPQLPGQPKEANDREENQSTENASIEAENRNIREYNRRVTCENARNGLRGSPPVRDACR